MNKRCFKVLIVLLFVFNLKFFGQNKLIDSLKQQIKYGNLSDTLKVDAFYTIGSVFIETNVDSSIYYYKKASSLSKNHNNYGAVEIYGNLGLLFSHKLENDSARYYYDKSLYHFDKEGRKDKELKATIYGNYAVTYENTSQFHKELEYSQKAIDLMIDNDFELCLWYFNHAMIYDHSGFKNQANKYLKLSYNISKKVKNYRVEAGALRKLGENYIEEKKLDSAQYFLEKGIVTSKKSESPEAIFENDLTIGRLYSKLKNFKKADFYLLKARDYAVVRNKKIEVLLSNVYMGELEFYKKNYIKSSKYFNDFNTDYKQGKDLFVADEAFKIWSEVENKIGNYKKSNQLLKEYMSIKDSLFNSKNRNLLAEADAKYELSNKEKEILENQILLQEKKTQNNYMIGISLFLLIGSVLLWLTYQQRQKRKNQEIVTLKRDFQIKTLESLIEGEEKERLRIAKELHDGVNGDLSAIKYKLSSLLEMNNKVIKEAVAMIDDSCKQVRAISHNLVPPSLENFNLVEATETYCNTMNSVSDIEIDFHFLGDDFTLSKKEEINIFRVIQELVSNSIKHSKGSEINVQISHRNKLLQVTVEDNGNGFDNKKNLDNGIGLQNIKSRTNFLQATVDLVTNSEGTSYTFEINLEE